MTYKVTCDYNVLDDNHKSKKGQQMTNEQKKETLEATARTYITMAKLLKADNVSSWSSYLKKAKKAAIAASEIEVSYDETVFFKMAA